MLERSSGARVLSAEQRTPDASLQTVTAALRIDSHACGAWTRLDDSAPLLQHRSYRKTPRSLPENFRIMVVRDISPISAPIYLSRYAPKISTDSLEYISIFSQCDAYLATRVSYGQAMRNGLFPIEVPIARFAPASSNTRWLLPLKESNQYGNGNEDKCLRFARSVRVRRFFRVGSRGGESQIGRAGDHQFHARQRERCDRLRAQ